MAEHDAGDGTAAVVHGKNQRRQFRNRRAWLLQREQAQRDEHPGGGAGADQVGLIQARIANCDSVGADVPREGSEPIGASGAFLSVEVLRVRCAMWMTSPSMAGLAGNLRMGMSSTPDARTVRRQTLENEYSRGRASA